MVKYYVKILDERDRTKEVTNLVRGEVLPKIGESYPINMDGIEGDDRYGIGSNVDYRVVNVIHGNNLDLQRSKPGKLQLKMHLPIVEIKRQ